MDFIHLLLFGDQTIEKLSSIQSLVRHSKTSPAARTFLRQATDVVQLSFHKLSGEDHGWPGDIHTLLGLAEENARKDDPHAVIAAVLMCIGRLGELIVYVMSGPKIIVHADGLPGMRKKTHLFWACQALR